MSKYIQFTVRLSVNKRTNSW